MSTVKTTSKKTNREMEVEYDFGATLEDSVAKFGADVVHSKFVDSAIIALQAAVRTALDAGKTEAEVLQKVQNWKLGVVNRTPGVSSVDKAITTITKLPEEQRRAAIEKMKAQLAALQAGA